MNQQEIIQLLAKSYFWTVIIYFILYCKSEWNTDENYKEYKEAYHKRNVLKYGSRTKNSWGGFIFLLLFVLSCFLL